MLVSTDRAVYHETIVDTAKCLPEFSAQALIIPNTIESAKKVMIVCFG